MSYVVGGLSAGRLNRRIGVKDTFRSKAEISLRSLKESVRIAVSRAEQRAAERDARVVVTRIQKEGGKS